MLHSIDFELIRASDFVKQNENYKAEIIYNKILEKFPKNIRASDALKSLEKNTSKIKSSFNQMQAIKECFNNNQKDKALKLALDLEKKDNSNAELYNILGVLYYNKNNIQDAEINYKKAISINPKFSLAYSNLGNLYSDNKNFFASISSYKEAIKIDPYNDQYLNNMALLLSTCKPDRYNEEWVEALELALIKKTMIYDNNFHTLNQSSISILKLHSYYKKIKDLLFNNKNFTDLNQILNEFSKIKLFHLCIEDTKNFDTEFETFLRDIRYELLFNKEKIIFTNEILKFLQSLALHCHNNEYVSYESDNELIEVKKLKNEIETNISIIDNNTFINIIILGCYKDLSKYEWIKKINFPFELLKIKERFVTIPIIEKKYIAKLEQIKPIQNKVSIDVKKMYEENPYPKWSHLKRSIKKVSLHEYLNINNIQFNKINSNDRKTILIAGCGTGKEAILTAMTVKDCNIIAIDLSSKSLGYAIRKSKEYNINNIRFIQGDILDLPLLNIKFDCIFCSGVIHHMANPYEGLQVLNSSLKNNGLMKLALYSKLGRQKLYSIQQSVKKYPTNNLNRVINRFRHEIIESKNENFITLKNIGDFFSTSELRDLIFHIQEHQYTIPLIKKTIKKLNLNFCGFENINNHHLEFIKFNSSNKNLYDLDHWDYFEKAKQDTFKEMYNFWLQKVEKIFN